MKQTFVGRSLAGLAVLAVILSGALVSPAAAQGECTCVLPVGSVGSIASVTGNVYVPGSSGLVVTTAGASLSEGSSVLTAEGASASIDLGTSCKFSMQGSMSLRVVPQEGGLCVQVYDDSLVAAPATGGGEVGAAIGLAAGAGVLVSLGFLLSVSQ
jgi:hypothetical protein